MKIRMSLVIVGIVVGSLFAVAVESLHADASGKKKQCGGNGGTNNKSCPECIGNCNFVDEHVQKYKVCEQAGDTCEDNVDTFCTGRIMTGGADGIGCDGTVMLDPVGFPLSCQTNTLKKCT